MTPRGLMLLEQELQHLQDVAIPNVIKAVQEARMHGDLSENAEYSAAKEQLSLLESRKLYVQRRLSAARVVDASSASDVTQVVFGVFVTLLDLSTNKQVVYQIVGEDEADFKNGSISFSSPVAKSLIGKTNGDIVEISVPGGTKEYEILSISNKF